MSAALTHYAFPTRDIDATLRFYCKLCGMRSVKQRTDSATGARVVWLAPESGDFPIVVVIEDSDAPEIERRKEPYSRHLGFEVGSREEVDARAERFREAGFYVAGPEYVDDVVGYIFLVRDLDGRVVEFSAEQDVSPANWD